jgi:hypothetical protein
MKDTNIEHITNLTLQQGWNWNFTWICKEKKEPNDNNETRTLGVMQIYVTTYFLEQYIVVDQSLPW